MTSASSPHGTRGIQRSRGCRAIFALALGVLALAAPVLADEDIYRLEMSGEVVGWAVERTTRLDGRVTTESEMEMRVSRGGTEIAIEVSTRFVESDAGKAIEMSSRQVMGQVPVEQVYRFAPEGLEMTSRQGEREVTRSVPTPEGAWLTPAAVERLVAERIARGAQTLSYTTLDPALGTEPVSVESTRLDGTVVLETPEGQVEATVWREVRSLMGDLESTTYFDADGRLLRSESELLGQSVAMILTTSRPDLDARPAPELLVASFIRPSEKLDEPRRLERAVYRLSLEGGQGPSDIPSFGAQTATQTEGGVRVEVSVGGEASDEEPPSFVPYLAASTYLDHRDPAVRSIAERALEGDERGADRKAERLRRYVHRYLSEKDLATGFATASEAAVSRSGDCTEHGVLLAALLRVEGIPSRVVGGLLYVESFAGENDIFGYHMWTQAWIEGRWVDLDAMLPGAFDAAHIALEVSALEDGDGFLGPTATLTEVMGRLSIEVLETGRR